MTYYASTDKQIVLNTTGMGYHHGSRWHRGGSMQMATTTSSTIITGTLVIDMWDRANEELIWRGQVSDTIHKDPGRNADLINKGVAKTFDKFPPY